ncbi:MAG: hypothetical protein OYI31_00140 [Chloroflexota bacterium]|nr:hypothetical protein [Chloroflexota bacterium]MDE2941487.1 hypothetical protein [Chloroflexota bacterium]MDE3266865.1 hypothetical protein [Chloroflexota bacterium]
MSKLIDRLEKVGTVAPAPMGFAAGRAAERAPALLMLALSGAKDAASTGLQADGCIISAAKATKPQLKAAKQAMGDQLWGLWPGTANGVSLDQIKEQGGDFVVFSSVDTPAELLADEELGRLIVIPIEFPEELGHSLEDFPVDAVVVAGLEDASPLSVKALMQVRAVRDLVAKPLLLLRAKPLNRGELVVLQDVGIQGLVVDCAKVAEEDASRMAEDIKGLPPRRQKRDHAGALLPRVSSGSPAAHQHDDDDEEEDFD